MANFEFKLQPVLDQRRREEDERQRDLAQQMRQRMILQTQLRTLQQSITDDKRSMGDALVGRVDVSRIRQHARHAGHVTQRAQQLALSLLGVEKRIEHARERLLEATRARKAIELLRQKQERAWRREQDRREAAALDEIATQAYVRQMREAVA